MNAASRDGPRGRKCPQRVCGLHCLARTGETGAWSYGDRGGDGKREEGDGERERHIEREIWNGIERKRERERERAMREERRETRERERENDDR